MVKFEKYPIQIQDFMKTINRSRGICRTFLNLIKKNRKKSTCNQFILETTGSQHIMPKNFLDQTLTFSTMNGENQLLVANEC